MVPSPLRLRMEFPGWTNLKACRIAYDMRSGTAYHTSSAYASFVIYNGRG